MKRLLIHIVGLIQLVVSILLIVKWLSKPTNVGQLGADNIVFIILLAIVVTVVSLLTYLKMEKNGIEKLTPFIIACLTVLTIVIAVPIKEKVEENNKPLVTAELGHYTIKLFDDNEYEISTRSAEYMHFDRGVYKRTSNQIILDKYVNTDGGFTNFFFINDTTLYLIDNRSLDTVVFKIKR